VTIHLHPAAKLIMHGAIPPLTHTPSWRHTPSQTTLPPSTFSLAVSVILFCCCIFMCHYPSPSLYHFFVHISFFLPCLLLPNLRRQMDINQHIPPVNNSALLTYNQVHFRESNIRSKVYRYCPL